MLLPFRACEVVDMTRCDASIVIDCWLEEIGPSIGRLKMIEREGKFYIYDLDDRSDYMAADTLEELAARCSDELKLAGWY